MAWESLGEQKMQGGPKGGINTKTHAAVDAHGMPVNFPITARKQVDCTQGDTSPVRASRQALRNSYVVQIEA